MKTTTIIFDMTGVLFKENKVKLLRKIGIKRIINYVIRHRASPLKICLDTLQAIYNNEHHSIDASVVIFRKRAMPQCIVDWQLGLITQAHMVNILDHHLYQLNQQKFFASKQEYKFVHHFFRTLLNPGVIVAVAKPMKHTIKLVQQLRQKNCYHLFILSNMGLEPFALAKQKYPEIFSLFDDCIISANVHLAKPEPEIFEYLLKKYNLTPQECIFIDDQEENIVAAQKLGITGILFEKVTTVRKKLKQLHIL